MAVWKFSYLSHGTNGRLVVNSLHYANQNPEGGSDPALDDILDSIDTPLRTAYRACLATDYTLDSAELREELPSYSTDVPRATSKVINQAGTLSGSGGTIPDGMAMTVKLRTDAASRSARGYISLPSPRYASFLSVNEWQGTFLTNAETFAALLDDDYEIGSVTVTSIVPMVYSRTRHDRQEDPYTFQVQEGIPRKTVTWRRSRMTVP